MLALSLLLSAAAGANALLGGKVGSVFIDDKSFICAKDCAFGGVYFGVMGYFCPKSEVIVRVDERGNTDRNFPFDCIGAKKLNSFNDRPPSNGEEPQECPLVDVASGFEPYECDDTSTFGAGTETVQWSDIEKEIKAAAAHKSQKECAKNGSRIFAECSAKSGGFAECNEKAAAAIKSCQGPQ